MVLVVNKKMSSGIVITKTAYKIEAIRIYLNKFIFICWAPPYSKITIDFNCLNWLSLDELKKLKGRTVFIYE